MSARPPKKDDSLKRHRRAVTYAPEPVRVRLQYLCDFLFAGDAKQMSAALNIYTHHVRGLLSGRVRVTVSVAAHIVSRLNVHVAWLVCGTGPIFQTTPSPPNGLALPRKMHTRRPLLDTMTYNVAPKYVPVPLLTEEPTAAAPYREAAAAVYAARVAGAPVGFFLGGEVLCAATRSAFKNFYTEQYATFLVMALAQLRAELALSYDVEDLTPLFYNAARAGLGCGDVVAKWAKKNAGSLLYQCGTLDRPLFVVTEVGEVAAHFSPMSCGAELGAAVGAAAYVDLLTLVEQVRVLVAPPGGVFICAGEPERAARVLLRCAEAVAAPDAQFTFVSFGALLAPTRARLEAAGGIVIYLDAPSPQTVSRFFRMCDAVYFGHM